MSTVSNAISQSMSEMEIIDRIRRFLRMPEAALFLERLQEKQRRALTELKNSDDLITTGRSQGQLLILDWILRLRQEED